MIKPVMEKVLSDSSKSVEFGILTGESVVDIRFSVSAADELFVDEAINTLKLEFKEILQDNVLGADGDTTASVVGRLLLENKKTVSFAESCTGGMIASAATDIPGSSLYFKGSVVAYSNDFKMKLLGVRKETLKSFGAVSGQTAEEMAAGVLKLSGSDYALSATGIAGPLGSTKEKHIGLVYIGLACKNKTESFRFNFHGARIDIRKRAANTALDLLRRKLIAEHSKR